MRNRLKHCSLFCTLASALYLAASQPTAVPDQPRAVPEMARLAEHLVGSWDTTEIMERSDLFPNGGSRHGRVQAKLAAGGTTLIYEVHTDGSAGKLNGLLVIWWEKDSGLYRFFICFNNPKHPCLMRGTGHWDGDVFMNDYEEVIDGKSEPWRDSFTFTPTTHTLVAARRKNDSTWETLITTHSLRRR